MKDRLLSFRIPHSAFRISLMRLDQFLRASRLVLRRTVAQELCEAGAVLMSGKPAGPSSFFAALLLEQAVWILSVAGLGGLFWRLEARRAWA